MAKKKTGTAGGEKKAESPPIQTKAEPEIVAQNTPDEVVEASQTSDVGESPEERAARLSKDAREIFVRLTQTPSPPGLIEAVDVLDIPSNGVLLRVTHYKDDWSAIVGTPQFLHVPDVRPDFLKNKLIRSLR